jgi:hypothetical protein
VKWLVTEETALVQALQALGEEVILELRPEPEPDDDPQDFPIGRHLARHAPNVLLAAAYDRPPGLDKGAVLMWRRGAPGRRVVGVAHRDPEGYQRQLLGQRRQCALPAQGLDLYCSQDATTVAQLTSEGRRALLIGVSPAIDAAALLAAVRAIGAAGG